MKKRVTINQKHTIYSQSQKEESGSITQKKIIKTRKEKKQKEQRRNKNQQENKVEDGDKYIHIKNYLNCHRTKHTKDTKWHTE